MKRLTKKEKNIYTHTFNDEERQFAVYDLCKKLGQLEDIEEELGIDLITLFKAIKEGVWFSFKNMKTESFSVKYKNKKHHIIPTLRIYQNAVGTIKGYLEINHENWDYCYSLYPEYYGKTWSLTKEELE